MFGYVKEQRTLCKFIFLVKNYLYFINMLATSSIVAIALLGTSVIFISTLCRIYYKKAKKRTKYELLF